METKRCIYCHKLQRAEARVCSRCGRPFDERKPGGGRSRRETTTQFSRPAASPHHAGHYSGLHPEDQPYISNYVVVPRSLPKDGAEVGDVQPEPKSEPKSIMLPESQERNGARRYRDISRRPVPRQVSARRSRRVSTNVDVPDPEPQPPVLPEDKPTQPPEDRGPESQPSLRPFVSDVTGELHRPASRFDEDEQAEKFALQHVDDGLLPEQQPVQPQQEPYPYYSAAREDFLADPLYDTDAGLSVSGYESDLTQLWKEEDRTTWKRRGISRLMTSVIVAAVFFLLVSSSILMLVVLGKHPTTGGGTAQLTVSPHSVEVHDVFSLQGSGFVPGHVVTFVVDAGKVVNGKNGQPLRATIDVHGRFVVQSVVPDGWSVGNHTIYAVDQTLNERVAAPLVVRAAVVVGDGSGPVLQLSTTEEDFDAAAVGVVSSQTLTLENAGTGTLVWQESSDQAWISTSPASGSFTQSENIQVSVNRSGTDPGTYTGQITLLY